MNSLQYVSWALSDFDITGTDFETMDLHELDTITSSQINTTNSNDRDILHMSFSFIKA